MCTPLEFAMKRLIFAVTGIFLSSYMTPAQAAPSVTSVQREIDQLRTVATTKFESANETKIKIANLLRESRNLRTGQKAVQKQVDSSKYRTVVSATIS